MTVRLLAVALALLVLPSTASAQTQLQDKFFDSNGVSIRYVEAGAGEPIILAHGNGGSLAGWVDSGVLSNLATDYRVVAFDWRGHGKSGKPHDSKMYGREMSLDIVRLLDHLGFQKAHIVGFSLGSGLTSLLLTIHPERFLTATLVAGAGPLEWTPAQRERAERDASEREHECISRSLIQRLLPPNAPMPSEEELQAQSKACMANPNQDRFALAAIARGGAGRVIAPAAAAAVTVPTLAIVGNRDPNLAGLQNLQKLRPAIKLVVVEGATHGGETGIVRRPELIANLRQFISAQRGAKTN
jgi:pimeloyl-ACP methyl ester carboxylesterase